MTSARKEYALYRGEELLAMGDISEIASATGKSKHFLRYMTYPIYARRISQRKHGKRGVLEMVCIDEGQKEE